MSFPRVAPSLSFGVCAALCVGILAPMVSIAAGSSSASSAAASSSSSSSSTVSVFVVKSISVSLVPPPHWLAPSGPMLPASLLLVPAAFPPLPPPPLVLAPVVSWTESGALDFGKKENGVTIGRGFSSVLRSVSIAIGAVEDADGMPRENTRSSGLPSDDLSGFSGAIIRLMTHGTLFHIMPESLPINSRPPSASASTRARPLPRGFWSDAAVPWKKCLNSSKSISLESSLRVNARGRDQRPKRERSEQAGECRCGERTTTSRSTKARRHRRGWGGGCQSVWWCSRK